MWIRSRKKSSGGGGGGTGGIVITVTCEEVFAGKVITCTDGTTTYTQTCPSSAPYVVEFQGISAGVWTVSAVISGQTIAKNVTISNADVLLTAASINVNDPSKWNINNSVVNGNIAIGSSGLVYSRNANVYSAAGACFKEMVDFSKYSTMVIKTLFTGDTSSGGIAIGFSVHNEIGSTALSDYTDGFNIIPLTEGINTIDISSINTSKYFKVGPSATAGSSPATYTIESISLRE